MSQKQNIAAITKYGLLSTTGRREKLTSLQNCKATSLSHWKTKHFSNRSTSTDTRFLGKTEQISRLSFCESKSLEKVRKSRLYQRSIILLDISNGCGVWHCVYAPLYLKFHLNQDYWDYYATTYDWHIHSQDSRNYPNHEPSRNGNFIFIANEWRDRPAQSETRPWVKPGQISHPRGHIWCIWMNIIHKLRKISSI